MSRQWAAPVEEDAEQYSPHEVFEAGERNHHISNTSYPIAHSKVWKPYKVSRDLSTSVMQSAFASLENLCLYSHIPFCETRCFYCEYTVVDRSELTQTSAYMKRLNQELMFYRDLLGTRQKSLQGFDIGGGTPSFVEVEHIATHIEQVRASFICPADLEISIETTPKIAATEPQKMRGLWDAGIRRISMGVQVTQPDLLRVLNRSENGIERQRLAVDHIRAAGFKKFNLDLMYGFAGQSIESWRCTLKHALSLAPEYITLYRMRYKLTRISDQANQVQLEDVRAQARLAKEMLQDAGYVANPGKNTYSKIPSDVGTSSYLTRRVVLGTPYLGIGLGAQSFSHTTISYNDGAAGKNLSPYFRSIDAGIVPIQDLYQLPLVHMAAKMCAVSFYFGEIDLQAFEDKFSTQLENVYRSEVEYLLREGLMEYRGGPHSTPRQVASGPALSLTQRGADHFNGVIALFFAPSVKKYLLDRDPLTAQDMLRNQKLALQVNQRQSQLGEKDPSL